MLFRLALGGVALLVLVGLGVFLSTIGGRRC